MPARDLDRRRTVAIIGKTPPPIGGVTIHVSRLLRRLAEEGVSFVHYDPGKDSWLGLVGALLQANVVHVHVSNSYLRLILVLLCGMLRRKSLLTLHGNLGRYGVIRNSFDRAALRLSDKPILLNAESLTAALAMNQQSELIPSFIPPENVCSTSDEITGLITRWRGGMEAIFCTNAHARVFDKEGKDIYGAEFLLNIFSGLPNMGLVFSDPSGTYAEHFNSSGTVVTENVLVIAKPHSFIEVLKNCDCMIRATTTDGDSISIKEALYLGVNVIASDCVTRPEGCLTYPTGDGENLARLVKGFKRSEVSGPLEDAVPLLIRAYRSLGVGLLE